MSANQRKAVYLALVAANAALAAVSSQAGLSGLWASGLGVLSLVVAMALKEFSAEDPPK